MPQPEPGAGPAAGARARREPEPRRVHPRPRPAEGGHVARPIGMEAAGEVVKVGAGVTGFTVGRARDGPLRRRLLRVRAAWTCARRCAMPAGLASRQAAVDPAHLPRRARHARRQGRLKRRRDGCSSTGVSSGVGVGALQAAKALGAKVIGTSGSQDKLDQLKADGLDVGIRTRAADFHDAVMKATGGKGVNLVVNTVGGSVFAECIRCAGLRGPARDRGLRRRHAEGRDRHPGAAREAPHALRRLQQAAHARAARRPACRLRARPLPRSPPAASAR